MEISEDGTVTGSIDFEALDQVEPKTDEAEAQHATLKAQRDEGQQQAEEDTEEPVEETESVEVTETETVEATDAEAADLDELRAEAEDLGIKVDGRWGAERLQSEIDAYKEG